MRKRLPMLLSAALFGLAALGALREVRRLDAVESPHVNSVAGATWLPLSPTERAIALGSFSVPPDGSARLMVCSRGALHGAFRVTHEGRAHSERLTLDDARSGRTRRCYTARWRAPATRGATVSLSLTARSPAPALERLDASAGAVITPWSAWPMLLALLSVSVFIFTKRSHPEKDSEFLDSRPSRVLSIAALVAVQIVGQVPTAYMGFGSVSLLYGLLVQHGAMVLLSAALLGALSWRHRRPLPFGAVAPEKLWRVLASAAVLLAIAVAVGYLVHDASDTPLGQVLERIPLRYVIALGALLAPLPEELYFRGVLVDAFSRRGEVVGVWVAALIFTGMHAPQLWGSPVALLPIALVGIVNGYLRVYTRSLTAPWLVHTVYNTVLASSVLLDR